MRMNQEVLNKEEGVLFWHEFKIKASIPNTIQPEDKQSRIKQTLLTFNQTQAQALLTLPRINSRDSWVIKADSISVPQLVDPKFDHLFLFLQKRTFKEIC